jgi:divinyl chlorophyllide a 8-vinyl-reductase
VLLLGATGTIGQATAGALCARGHDVVAVVRPGPSGRRPPASPLARLHTRQADVTDLDNLRRAGIGGERFDILVSCLASRSGTPADAWAIDHRAHLTALTAAREAGVRQVVLVSAICVQKPRLAFQHAKLAFEAALISSGLTYSIVRPTAYFKSLSGQVARVQAGKPFLVFGDGKLTACKPISDADLGAFVADCIDDPSRHDRILPIGGPGPAITPLDQAALLADVLGRRVPTRQVPVRLLDAIIAATATIGRLLPRVADKAELARIGRYYATESMLVWDAAAQRYDAAATPQTGRETLRDHYARLVRGDVRHDLDAHAVY